MFVATFMVPKQTKKRTKTPNTVARSAFTASDWLFLALS